MSIKQAFINVDKNKFSVISPFFRTGPKTETSNRDTSKINTVVLHWTAGASVGGDIKSLKKKGYGYHFLIDLEGNIVQGAPIKKKLSHAGNSYGPNGNYLNSHSIGVSFSMLGDEKKKKGSTVFNEQQIDACKNLLLDLKVAIPTLKFLTGHHWISPGRKIDPYTFPFGKLMGMIRSANYVLWKTGHKPFPNGLTNCKCVKQDTKGNCIESTGPCSGPGGYKYSERALSTKVSELSFGEDITTE